MYLMQIHSDCTTAFPQPWVEDGSTTINVDPQIMNWIKDSKEWLDAGYLNTTVKGQWNDDWNKAMGSESKVFAFLFPAWGIDFTLSPNWDGDNENGQLQTHRRNIIGAVLTSMQQQELIIRNMQKISFLR